MSGATLLGSGAEQIFGNITLPDLESRFEKHLEQVRSVTDLEPLLKSLKTLLKDKSYTKDEQERLKRLRQRAYDRRRNPKLRLIKSAPDLEARSRVQISGEKNLETKPVTQKTVPDISPQVLQTSIQRKIMHHPQLPSAPQASIAADSFSAGIQRALSSIDGERFMKTAPKLLGWFISAALVSFFLWQQSLALYESADFGDSKYTALGGILMITGFAAYHAIARSWLAMLFCVYAMAYEGYLMVSGTIHDDATSQARAIAADPELVLLQEKADKERAKYHELKTRYDDPESKVFQNEWFSKNHLSPAWESSAKAQEALVAKRSALLDDAAVGHITWLKIFYRLGLVLLCMVLVHRFFAFSTEGRDSRAVER